MRDIKQVRANRWETENGDYIWRDDFGAYIVRVNGTTECTNTFDKALKIINNNKYYKLGSETDMTNLRKYRLKKDWSKKELAERSGVSVNMIVKYENRERDIDKAQIETLAKLAQALECKLQELLEDEELKELINTVI